MGHIPSINYIHVHRTEKTRSNSQTANQVRHKRKKKTLEKNTAGSMEKRNLPKRINQRRKKSAARNERNYRKKRTGKTLNQKRTR